MFIIYNKSILIYFFPILSKIIEIIKYIKKNKIKKRVVVIGVMGCGLVRERVVETAQFRIGAELSQSYVGTTSS